jgi:hypothetical protein
MWRYQARDIFHNGVIMNPKTTKGNGIRRLREMYRKRFRIPENTEHYSKEDYKKAEKKYIKLCLITGSCER